jgi:hypothetical protein
MAAPTGPPPDWQARYLLTPAKFVAIQETMKTSWLKPDEIYGLLLSYKSLGLKPATVTLQKPPCPPVCVSCALAYFSLR